MQVFLKILYLAYSPILVVLYWRNSMKSLDNVHGPFDIHYAD
jgi:hypothetical protein